MFLWFCELIFIRKFECVPTIIFKKIIKTYLYKEILQSFLFVIEVFRDLICLPLKNMFPKRVSGK